MSNIQSKVYTNLPRSQWVDIVKGIAIVLVVYRHILIGIQRASIYIHPYYLEANEIVYSFRMPLFFLLSGIFFQKSFLKRGLKIYSVQKLKTLLYPYVLWCLVIISLQILMNNYVNANRTWLDYSYILLKPRAIDQMWFLLALFNISILYALLYHVTKKKIGLILILSLVMLGFRDYVQLAPIKDIFQYMIYLSLGVLVSRFALDPTFMSKIGKRRNFLFLVPFFILSQWYWLSHDKVSNYIFLVISLIGSLFVIVLSVIYQQKRIMSIFKLVGVYSLQIYIIHPMIGAASRMVFVRYLRIDNSVLILIIGMILGVVMPIVIYKLCQKINFTILFKLP